MIKIIKKLQDPQLVADFQHYLGVQKLQKQCYFEKQDHQLEASTIVPNVLVDDNLSKTNKSYKKSHRRYESDASNVSECSTSSGSKWLRIFDGGTVGGSEGSMDEDTHSESETKDCKYVITNKFWYSLFFIATKTGDEVFYIIFFPFWNWNVDGSVMRRVMMIWMITMYIGQALKDILKVPRPSCPPVIRLDPKWCLEYGLPSTHAMVGYSIPFSVLTLSVSRYQLDWFSCFVIAFVWCVLVCTSRLYLGMHTFLDIISGLILIACLMGLILPFIDVFDRFTLTHPFSPVINIMLTVAMVVCYPNTEKWNPARGDTTVIVGVGCGCLVGSWLNYQMGIIRDPSILPPYSVIWPSINMIGLGILRTVLGLVLLIAVRAIFKSLSIATVCAFLQASPSDYKNKTGKISYRGRLIVEIIYKFITYVGIGFTIVFTAPLAFKIIGIERPTYYTEV